MRLTPFNLTQNISVDNALSTIQVIHQLIAQMNNVVEELNNIDSTANSYTDSEIEKVKTIISSLESELKSLIETNSTDIALLQGAINVIESRLEELNSYVDSKNLEILNLVNTNYKTLCALYSAFKNEVIELLNANEPVVTNPTNGLKDKLSKCLLDVYTVNRVNTLDLSISSAKKIGDIYLDTNDNNKLNTMQVEMIKTLNANTRLPLVSYKISGISSPQYTRSVDANIRNARYKPVDFMMSLANLYASKLGFTSVEIGNKIYNGMYSSLGLRLLFSTDGWNTSI